MTAGAIGSAIVLGAGPAGCSCASWLAQQGIATTLVEAQSRPLSLLRRLDLRQDWVLGAPATSTAALADAYEQHVQALPLVQWRCGVRVTGADRLADAHKVLRLSDGSTLEAEALVLATGLRPRPHPWAASSGQPLPDAVALTQQRQHFGGRILLLGGGDNAAENALFFAGRGNEVVLWSRDALRAQPMLQRRMASQARISQRVGVPMPGAIVADGPHWRVESAPYGRERFDKVAVLFGFEPDDEAWSRLRQAPAWAAAGWPDAPPHDAAQWTPHGIFVAGDFSMRLHPSIQTALADGVTAAKQVNEWFSHRLPSP